MKQKIITFTIKTGYYVQLLLPKTMKLIGRTKIKINKNKHSEDISHLEIIELVLVHCNIVSNDYQRHSRLLCIYICSKQINCSIIKYFTQKFYI